MHVPKALYEGQGPGLVSACTLCCAILLLLRVYVPASQSTAISGTEYYKQAELFIASNAIMILFLSLLD